MKITPKSKLTRESGLKLKIKLKSSIITSPSKNSFQIKRRVYKEMNVRNNWFWNKINKKNKNEAIWTIRVRSLWLLKVIKLLKNNRRSLKNHNKNN